MKLLFTFILAFHSNFMRFHVRHTPYNRTPYTCTKSLLFFAFHLYIKELRCNKYLVFSFDADSALYRSSYHRYINQFTKIKNLSSSTGEFKHRVLHFDGTHIQEFSFQFFLHLLYFLNAMPCVCAFFFSIFI